MLEALCHEYGCSMVEMGGSGYGLTASVEDGWIWVMSWQLADRTGQITLIRLPVGSVSYTHLTLPTIYSV